MIHTVVRGDSLSSIAKRYGISDWRLIYDSADNAAFRAKRPNPALIAVGDKLVIPSTTAKTTTTTGKTTGTAAGTTGKTTTSKTTTGGVSSGAKGGAEPEFLVASEVAKGITAGLPKYIEFLVRVTGSNVDDVADALDFLSKRADGVEFIVESYKAYKEYGRGKNKEGTIALLKAMAKGWKAFPSKIRNKTVQGLAKILRKIPKISPVGDMIPAMDQCNTVPSLLLLLAAMMEGKPVDARNATKDLIDALKSHPGQAAIIAKSLVELFLGFLPTTTKTRLLAKMGGRKVPVVGTAIVLVSDAISIFKASTASNSTGLDHGIAWSGLASTVAGLFPGVGTAISVVIDLGIVIMTCINEIGSIQLSPSGNPTT